MVKAYEHRHVVTFEETNLLGNVYYIHPLRWQGICREMFLREHAPAVVEELDRGLVLSTARCSCRYGQELKALDAVAIRMRLKSAVWNRILLEFEVLRLVGEAEEQVAVGEQEIACMRREGGRIVEREIPRSLREALEPYRS
jgi:enediyne core biosynthesis thioesterase